MKIFISADLEGVNGVVAPEDVEEAGSGYQQARVFMTEEVNAVVEGAFAGGASEILVCDSHNVSQNIRMDLLDSRVRLMRGVSRRNSMVHGLDETFDGLILLAITPSSEPRRRCWTTPMIRSPSPISASTDTASGRWASTPCTPRQRAFR